MLRTLGHNLIKFPMWKSVIDLNDKNVRYGIANSQATALQESITQELTLESGRIAWQISMWFLYKKPLTKVAYEQVTCPILVMGGSVDKITPITIQRDIAKKYNSQATLIEIEGACHWTVGGSYLGTIAKEVFEWLNNSTNSVRELDND